MMGNNKIKQCSINICDLEKGKNQPRYGLYEQSDTEELLSLTNKNIGSSNKILTNSYFAYFILVNLPQRNSTRNNTRETMFRFIYIICLLNTTVFVQQNKSYKYFNV